MKDEGQMQSIKAIVPYQARRHLKNIAARVTNKSFSQLGEDHKIFDLLGKPKTGFYVDIGAHDPRHISNTHYFYIRGWTGINVEPIQYKYEKFTLERPKDINIRAGVAKENGDAMFYHMSPPGLSTFSEEAARELEQFKNHRIISTESISIFTLEHILAQHAADRTIDFMSVDVEGTDEDVLYSNDWERFRPTLVVVERSDYAPKAEMKTSEHDRLPHYTNIMKTFGYSPVWSNKLNAIFKSDY